MLVAKLGLKRDSGEWIHCGDLYVNPSTAHAWVNLSAVREGLLQGRALKAGPYIEGDLMYGSQKIGFINTSETGTGVWYTATFLLIPVVKPAPLGIIRVEII